MFRFVKPTTIIFHVRSLFHPKAFLFGSERVCSWVWFCSHFGFSSNVSECIYLLRWSQASSTESAHPKN